MTRKAIIIGSRGQDGSLLSDLLSRKGYAVIGIDRGSAILSGAETGTLSPVDILQFDDLHALMERHRPDELYYFAAYHHSSEDRLDDDAGLFQASYAIHVTAYLNVLEAVRRTSPGTRIFYATSSHMFKGTPGDRQDEATPINPVCVYGITKAAGFFTGRYYRHEHGLFVSNGILYNHESSLRPDKFVSMKIIKSAMNIKKGVQDKLILGNLDAEIDWGYAPDFVDAFHRILQLDLPDDFIVATGKRHRVRDFVALAFEALDLDWHRHVEERRSLITKQNFTLVGSPAKLMAATGWRPTVDLSGMIKLLLQAEGAGIHDE